MSIRDLVLAKLEKLPEPLLQEVNQAIDQIIDQHSADDPDFAKKIEVARRGIKKYHNVLNELTK